MLMFFVGFSANAQIGASSEGAYAVEFAKFSPPTKEMIAEFEGFPAIPFIANDQHNVEINLGSSKGTAVLLWFMDTNNSLSTDQIPLLNELTAQYKNKGLKVIAFNEGSREVLNQYVAQNQVDFSMIPHAGIFGEGPYGGELGYPRLFMIDSFGVIKKVLPSEIFRSGFDIKSLIVNFLNETSTLR